MPTLDSCDNSNLIPGFLTFTIIGTDQEILSPNTPCLNPTRIPAAAATAPQFLVKNASGVEARAPTIAVKDNASGTVTTVRLNGNWFITTANGTSVQTLRLAYTDWGGTKQSAWLTGTPTDGFAFLTAALDSSATTSPVNCLDDGTCGVSPTLKYIGADGQQYAATVRGYRAPTGTPTFSAASEGSPTILDAGGFAPGNAVQPVTYRWSFKDNDCVLVFDPCTPSELASATGPTTTYTWDAGGTYRVDLTATDALGAQATTTLQVPVASLPPAFVFAPDCATSPNVPCNAWSGNQGAASQSWVPSATPAARAGSRSLWIGAMLSRPSRRSAATARSALSRPAASAHSL
ncbi:MAG TPA: PKD domain-containing protein [Chloroflexaceae bacterium]|nr:PKD domain-containing protein [Chloroflexaceae bacterium]